MRDALMANLLKIYDRLDELEKELESHGKDIDKLDMAEKELISRLEQERDDACRRARELSRKLISIDRAILGKI